MSNKKKQKIIYLVTQPEHGGAQQYVYDLAIHLDPREWDVYVAAGQDPKGWLFKTINNKQLTINKGIKTIYLKHVKRNLHIWHDLMSGFELFKLFKKIKPNIIHVNSSKVGATGSVIGKLYQFTHNLFKFKIKNLKFKIKVIYTVHGLVLNEPTLKQWQYFYYKLSEKISGWFEDKLICVSEFDKKSVLKHKIAQPKKITTIHNGIPLNIPFLSRQSAQQTLNLQNLNFNIGFIGNLYSNKGLTYLIDAVKLLVTRYSLPITLSLLTNGGPEENKLENQINQLNLQNIVKFSNGQNAKLYLKAFDLFVLPSIKEGLSYTLIEALAAQLPIITTRVGGNPEIIQDEYNGLLVEPASPQVLAKAIYKIYADRNLKNKLIANTVKSAQKFSLDKMLQKTINIYNS